MLKKLARRGAVEAVVEGAAQDYSLVFKGFTKKTFTKIRRAIPRADGDGDLGSGNHASRYMVSASRASNVARSSPRGCSTSGPFSKTGSVSS